MPDIEVDIYALPKQLEVLESSAREVVYSGAYGAAKTAALCMWALVVAQQSPLCRVGLFRKRLVDFKATVLPVLIEGSGQLPPILTPGTYTHNKTDRVIRLRDGGVIEYFGLDDPSGEGTNIVGRNFTHAGGDQCEELTEKEFRVYVASRVRVNVTGVRNQMLLACNPGPPSHWMAKRYGLAGAEPDCEVSFAVVRTASADNPFLPPETIASLNALTGVSYRRYVMGEWCASEGVIYDNFLREKHVKTVPDRRFSRKWLAIDDGINNPFVCLLVGEDGDGGLHVIRENRARGLLEGEKVQICRDMGEIEGVVIDPAAAGIKTALRRGGFTVYDGNNDVLPGIGAVRTRLGKDAGGLTVDPSCAGIVEELESYEWDEDKEKPVKVNDHALDAVRYLVMHLERPAEAVVDASEFTKSVRYQRNAEPTPYALVDADRMDWSIAHKTKRDLRWVEGEGGWEVWARPDRGPYAMGVCVATTQGRGVHHAKVIDARTRQSVAALTFDGGVDDMARQVAAVSLLYGTGENPCAIVPKADGSGRDLIRHLARLRVGTWRNQDNEDGWLYGNDAQSKAFSDLRGAIRDGRYIELDPAVLEEMRRYVVLGAGQLGPWHAKVANLHPSLVSDATTATMLAWLAAGTFEVEKPWMATPAPGSLEDLFPDILEGHGGG